jgi:hypothetical protein
VIAVANSLTSLASTAPSGALGRNSRHLGGHSEGKINDVLKACGVDEQRYFISALCLEGEACFATIFDSRAAGQPTQANFFQVSGRFDPSSDPSFVWYFSLTMARPSGFTQSSASTGRLLRPSRDTASSTTVSQEPVSRD